MFSVQAHCFQAVQRLLIAHAFKGKQAGGVVQAISKVTQSALSRKTTMHYFTLFVALLKEAVVVPLR